MGIVRNAMGIWTVEGDYGVSHLVTQAASMEHPGNLQVLIHAAMAIPEGGVVVDAGACIGDQTGSYSQMVGVDGYVYAFEPYPVAYQALKKNMARFTNVTTIHSALGSSNGTVPFSIFPSNIGASCLGRMADCEVVEVPLTTLDTYLLFPGRLDFIHLDAEGMEVEILKGAANLIKKFQPSLLIEVTDEWLKRYGSTATGLLQLIASLGYFSLMKMQPNASQFDVLCIPQAKIAQLNAAHELTHAG